MNVRTICVPWQYKIDAWNDSDFENVFKQFNHAEDVAGMFLAFSMTLTVVVSFPLQCSGERATVQIPKRQDDLKN